MRVVFMGTPEFAVPSLRALCAAHEVSLVYTQPDRPAGRGRALRPSPVSQLARDLGVPVRQPASLRDASETEVLRALEPDVVCVAAYGLILPPEILEVPKFGCVNVHASLLPRHRGAAPVHRAILEGDRVTGVSIMRMEEGLDTGPYAAQLPVALEDLSLDEATALIAKAGANLLLAVLALVECGRAVWHPQDDSAATYAHKVTRGDLVLDPGLSAEHALRRIRASSRSAGARISVGGRPVSVIRAGYAGAEVASGEVAVTPDSLILGFADGALVLEAVRPEGRGDMNGACYARGARLETGATWEPCRPA